MKDKEHGSLVKRAIDYIENNIKQKVGLQDIAKHVIISKFHFHRMFSVAVGTSIADYIRKRRLTRAALELVQTNKRILDIAIDYHFQSQEAFTRAFKKMFHLTPGQYRDYSKLTKMGGNQMQSKSVPYGWTITGDSPNEYETAVDNQEVHQGRASGYLGSKGEKGGGFATLMQMFDASAYRGQRLKLTAFVKSNQVEGWAGLWMRIDGNEGEMLKFDNMQNRAITGTNNWNQYFVVLDIPVKSHAIAFGVLLAGKGKVWVDNFRFEVVDDKVPTTDQQADEGLPAQPVNLNFEEKQ
ncbi:helix-turn-helix transcriptional regulator [Paenibacillus eucommiae]|uniref:AraC-like DNA-binding protein n=1 Tax=Paenibacillus eucommiae TaxID=1355755 RepID=A0ABS4J2I8_9BACL|nr:AraC family transcriptional regulator [Paenibacillus eucommiae]MBP1994059.1 AraC-like DNA-binding protein [Paenibacillus eucommiae]